MLASVGFASRANDIHKFGGELRRVFRFALPNFHY